MIPGFIKLNRGSKTAELLKDSSAFILLGVIALRAKRTGDFNIHKLRVGEALVGDYANYGLTEQKYRAAKTKLEHWGFASFRPTNRGTIATLLNSDIYDINAEPSNERDNEPITNKQRSDNEQITTINKNKNLKNVSKLKYGDSVLLSDLEFYSLVLKLGLSKTGEMIQALNNGIGAKGYRYRSHFHAILTWVNRDEKRQDVLQNSAGRRQIAADSFVDTTSKFGVSVAV